jgi:hypothetical protein
VCCFVVSTLVQHASEGGFVFVEGVAS